MTSAPGAFWTWSLAVYGLEGLEECLIDLQDGHEADVNVILWCLWSASRSCKISSTQMAVAIETSNRWRSNVVGPIRAVRRWLKSEHASAIGAVDAFRNQVKQVELDAEHAQQTYLEQISLEQSNAEKDASARLALTRINLETYARHGAIDLSAVNAALPDALLIRILEASTPPKEPNSHGNF